MFPTLRMCSSSAGSTISSVSSLQTWLPDLPSAPCSRHCPYALSHSRGHQHTFPLLAPGLLRQWRRRDQHNTDHRSQGVMGPGARGRWTNPSFLVPPSEAQFRGTICSFSKGTSRAEPGHPQCNHLLTHLPALPSLSWASPCFLVASPRETTPTLVFVAGPAFGGPGLSHLPQAPNSSCYVPSHVL